MAGLHGSVLFKILPAAINVVTLSACLTNHTAAPAARGGGAEEPRLALFRAGVINVQLIELTTPASGAAALGRPAV